MCECCGQHDHDHEVKIQIVKPAEKPEEKKPVETKLEGEKD